MVSDALHRGAWLHPSAPNPFAPADHKSPAKHHRTSHGVFVGGVNKSAICEALPFFPTYSWQVFSHTEHSNLAGAPDSNRISHGCGPHGADPARQLPRWLSVKQQSQDPRPDERAKNAESKNEQPFPHLGIVPGLVVLGHRAVMPFQAVSPIEEPRPLVGF